MTVMKNGNSNDDGANEEDGDDDCAADEVHIHISCTKFTPWCIDYPFPYFGTCSTPPPPVTDTDGVRSISYNSGNRQIKIRPKIYKK